MDQLQSEFDAQYPALGIEIIGVNELGQDSANDLITSGRDVPWLQDVDVNNNGQSDVWDEQWDVVWRDVVIVDPSQLRRGDFNLSFNDLGAPENFELLKSTAVALAEENPIWQNDSNPMDVNNDSAISPVGDVLTCINELNNHVYSDAGGKLPVPAVAGSHPYLDVNGDYVISPVGDVLSLINYLNGTASGEGEGSDQSPSDGPTLDLVPTEAPHSLDTEFTLESPDLVLGLVFDPFTTYPRNDDSLELGRADGDSATSDDPEDLLMVLASDVAMTWG